MTTHPTRVLIIGGGFSGCAAAIALRQAGADVELIERHPDWAMDGAGISIGGATIRALRDLGVLDGFLAHGYAADGQDVYAANGTHIAEFETPRLAGADIPAAGAIMRPALGQVLVEAAHAAGARTRLGVVATHLEERGAEVSAQFSDGTTGSYDLVVSADGIGSATRGWLLPHAPAPTFSGQGAWRAVLPRPAHVTRTAIWVGGHVKVGVNPISASEMYLFVNENKTANERIPEEELLPRLQALLDTLPAPQIREMSAALTTESLVLYRPMFHLMVPLPWHRGRIVCIGDAVHATTPHLAAGAGIGIEDAIVLGQELPQHATVDAVLEAFEQRRFARCEMVVSHSERLGELETQPETQAEFVALQADSYRQLAQPI